MSTYEMPPTRVLRLLGGNQTNRMMSPMKAMKICVVMLFSVGLFLHQAVSQALSVHTDERIELLGVVQLIAGGVPTTTALKFPYRDTVEATFRPFADHGAIQMFRRMASRGFSFDAPVIVMLCCSDVAHIALRYPVPANIQQRSGGLDSIRTWLELLDRFVAISKFHAFYRSHTRYYARLAGETKALLEDDLLDRLHQYYGMREAGYEIVLSPLTRGGFGPRIEIQPGRWQLYSVASPSGYTSDTLHFFSSNGLRTLVWHEFAHSFVNPLTENYWSDLSGSLAPFDSIAAGLPQWYRQRKASLDEHIVRAVTVRMITLYRGSDAGTKATEQEVKWGFAFVPKIAAWLKDYEAHRDRWPSFAAFFPELVRHLATLDGQK